ncbi:ABC transporter ATP-binding protein [Clostridium sp. 'White wine YQ']|uniref:ABC transporter ATP-binding protein n=1 Tax=Clostridium sp. 'White wine YQ' TaxID=3027474 RepID=UPI002367186C|nr:ABC transporter ATP-binding protein [Clostridium sp. 'White wine YQ']MDD7795792.1 ABC transporter ATP-binding protein [Clostridium sp. 'White wine YQ']
MIRDFIKYYKPHKKLFIMDLFCAFLAAICDLFYPMITRGIINDYVPNKNLRLLVTWSIALLFIYILKLGLNYFVEYWGHVVGVRMQGDMRRDIFKHLQKLPFKYFDDNKTGVIMSRIINDLMDISELAHHGPEDLFLSIIMLIGSFVILCTINVKLTLITFAFIPFLLIFAIKKRMKMANAFKETRVKIGEVNASLENSVSGIRVSRAFTNRAYEIEKFEEGNNDFKRAREFAYKAMAEFFSGMNFIVDFLNLTVLSLGGFFTFKGYISVGDYVAYLLYIKMFMDPIKRLINFVEQLQSGMTGFERFKEIMEVPEEEDVDNAIEIKDVKGQIRFDNVSFKYDDEETHVLKELSLSINQGQTVALVGPSGGGKTTLCHLVPRFYEVDEGDIFIDNINIKDINRDSLRKNIGLVQQDVFLFTGTIYENILYGNPDASEEEVIEAAKRANIHDFIMSLPDGYNTYIGEKGLKLSGGQKQRMSIARVFLKNPKILILDEATSALDNTTELIIQKSLEELAKGRTTLIVAHRLSTIKNADEIVVLTAEGIAEKGNHQELLSKNGIYTSLYSASLK